MNNSFNISWDMGTAYDFITSLIILHDPKRYGLRAKWASAIRQRLPQEDRDLLESLMRAFVIQPPLVWLHESLTHPKNGEALLAKLQELSSFERVCALLGIYEEKSAYTEFAQEIIQRKAWDKDDLTRAKQILKEIEKPKPDKLLREVLDIWAQIEESGDDILKALQTYYDVFFADEEWRILAALQAGLERAQKLVEQVDFSTFFKEISQGVIYDEEQFSKSKKMIFIPSFWATPFVFISLRKGALVLFGARPDDTSLMPGEVIPDALINSLNAIADPNRLRILRYLSTESLTPTQLSTRLRLRTATVTHHLKTLRAAGLVFVKPGGSKKKEKHYSARTERFDVICGMLSNFVLQEE